MWKKRIVALSLFLGLSFFGLSLLWDNALLMMIITLLLITTLGLQLDTLYKILLYMYASGGVPGWCNESRVSCMKFMKVALPQIQCQLHVHAKSNMTMMERVIINEMVESCMAIYLEMAM